MFTTCVFTTPKTISTTRWSPNRPSLGTNGRESSVRRLKPSQEGSHKSNDRKQTTSRHPYSQFFFPANFCLWHASRSARRRRLQSVDGRGVREYFGSSNNRKDVPGHFRNGLSRFRHGDPAYKGGGFILFFRLEGGTASPVF